MPVITPLSGPPVTVTSITITNDVVIATGSGFLALTSTQKPGAVTILNDTTLTMPLKLVAKYA